MTHFSTLQLNLPLVPQSYLKRNECLTQVCNQSQENSLGGIAPLKVANNTFQKRFRHTENSIRARQHPQNGLTVLNQSRTLNSGVVFSLSLEHPLKSKTGSKENKQCNRLRQILQEIALQKQFTVFSIYKSFSKTLKGKHAHRGGSKNMRRLC